MQVYIAVQNVFRLAERHRGLADGSLSYLAAGMKIDEARARGGSTVSPQAERVGTR